uniref:Uncharacterized protein n=1 Tax=Rhizophora mucronata TaxID=61149 RepID=A0A2P2PW92_RHIMU
MTLNAYFNIMQGQVANFGKKKKQKRNQKGITERHKTLYHHTLHKLFFRVKNTHLIEY